MECHLALVFVLCMIFLPAYTVSNSCSATLENVRRALGDFVESNDSCSCEYLEKEIQDLKDLSKKLKNVPEFCYAGVSNGIIHSTDITASSSYPGCDKQFVALKSARAWCTLRNDQNQWIQIDVGKPKKIVGVATQGRANYAQWVRTYRVSYGNHPNSMSFYMTGGAPKEFKGNTDQNTIVTTRFPSAIEARYIRIYPVQYHGHMSMRIELLEC